jgi:hypothetical protein
MINKMASEATLLEIPSHVYIAQQSATQFKRIPKTILSH